MRIQLLTIVLFLTISNLYAETSFSRNINRGIKRNTCIKVKEMYLGIPYIALFTSVKMEGDFVRAIKNRTVTDVVNKLLEKEKTTLLIGSTTDGWIFSALTHYLESKEVLPLYGSEEGQQAAQQSDFIHLFIPSKNVAEILERIKNAHPEKDENFEKIISKYFRDMDNTEKYKDYSYQNSSEDYKEGFNSLIKHLTLALKNKEGLLVLIPF